MSDCVPTRWSVSWKQPFQQRSYAKNVQQTMRSSRSGRMPHAACRLPLATSLLVLRALAGYVCGPELKCWRHVMEITLKTH